MKRVKYLILALMPVLLVSCGFIEKTKVENKVGEKFYAELSASAYGDAVAFCNVSVDLGSKEEDGSYTGKIILRNTKNGTSADIPVYVWADGEEVTYKTMTSDSDVADIMAVLHNPDAEEEADVPELAEVEDEPVEEVEEAVEVLEEPEEVVEEVQPVIAEKEPVKEVTANEETIVNGVPSWLFGKWTCSTAYGTEIMWIDKDGVRSKNGNVEDTGTYTYSNGELRIQFSRERGVVTSIPVDAANRRLEYGGGYYWVKSN